MKGVEVRLQELGIYGKTLLFGLLYVFKHTEGQLSLHFFRTSGVQPSIKGHYRCVLQQGQFDDRFQACRGNSIPRNVNRFDILIIAQSLLQTFGESVSKLVAREYDLAQTALVQETQAFMVDYVRLMF